MTQQMLCFENSGEINPRLITTLGVNVKEITSPIGFFGTGLKYAIAISLRLNCQLSIQSGATVYHFVKTTEMLRGKEFDFIKMVTVTPGKLDSEQSLGFTTELGKTWEPWMAYRELWCNAKDEGGTTSLVHQSPTPTEGLTRVLVTGQALVQEHARRASWLLESTPVHVNGLCNIHRGTSSAVYYRGIKVLELAKPSQFTYDIQQELGLSENRTAAHYSALAIITRAIGQQLEDAGDLTQILLSPDTSLESTLDFDYCYGKASTSFIDTIDALFDKHSATINKSAVRLAASKIGKRQIPTVQISKLQQLTLTKSLAFLAKLGHEVTEPIRVIDTLGSHWIMGLANRSENTIYLPAATLERGTKFLAATLLEEHLHLKLGLADCDRDMQDWLLQRIMSLGEELTGEVL
jgi:hypothetical protein